MLESSEPSNALPPNDAGGAGQPMRVDGDLRSSLRVAGDVHVRGNVRPNLHVSVGGRLQVGGWVLGGCELFVSGDVEVLGGIENSQVHVDGHCTAAVVEECTLRIGNSLTVAERIRDTDLCVLGSVHVAEGSICGGQVVATELVASHALGEDEEEMRRRGSKSPRTTLVQISRTAARELFEIDLDLRINEAESALSRLETLWQPLIDDESLAAELSEEERGELALRKTQIESARSILRDLEARHRSLGAHVRDRSSRSPRVVVTSALHPGVEIRVWDRVFRFRRRVEGPLTITPSYKPPQEAVYGDA